MRALTSPLPPSRRLSVRAWPLLAAASLIAALLVPGCRTAPPPSEALPPAASAPDEPAPTLRLDERARPVSYDLRLAIDPAQPTFDGDLAIELDVRRPSRVLWLNGRSLEVESARVVSGSREQVAAILPGGLEFIGFQFSDPIPAGPATLHVSYRGTLEEKETAGAFRQKDGDRWYVFTQFEAIFARRAFPSFDEPGYKVPWRLTIDTPEGNKAYANMPVERQTAADRAGWIRYDFARSLPLPSYLVAFAVGPFDEVPAGSVGKTPLRILTLAGKAPQAAYASRVTAPIVVWQESYTGIPYAYGKLDSLSIPQTVGFGAMENVGLITYVEPLILAPPGEETVGFRRGYSRVAAHEIAHQWFGDLVTLEWWNDIWLNESFATWFGQKTIAALEPTWNPELDLVERRASAIAADSLDTARRIRQPIESEGDIDNAFDTISYQKGGTLLSSFEMWLGEEPFRRGIQSYLRQYSHANADAADFLRSLEGATRPGVAAAFSTFLDQSGVPLVSVGLRCDPGAAPQLALSQTRYLPAGSRGEADRLWQIPVCVRWGGASGSGRVCSLLSEPQGRLELTGASTCPEWVFANDGGIGYYLPRYEGGLLGKLPLSGGGITTAEQLSLVEDTARLASGGRLPAAEALDLAFALGDSPSRHLTEAALGIVEGMRRFLVPEDLVPAYTRLIRQHWGARALAAGLVPRAGESPDETLLRNDLVLAVGGTAEDPALRAEARRLVLAWLEDRAAVPAESVDTVLVLAALGGDEALFDRYMKALEGEKDRRTRRRLLVGLSSFHDPALLRRSLALLTDTRFDAREVLTSLNARFWDDELARVATAFLREHYDEIVARLPEQQASYLVYFGGMAACSAADAAEVDSFFRPRAEAVRGAPRALEQTLERIRLCDARRTAQLPEVRAYLEGR